MNFKKKYLSKDQFPYFISEIGINHNGYLNLALKMIKLSKKAGFNAVKFQKRDINDILNFGLTPKKSNGYLSKNEADIKKATIKFGGWVYPDTRLELSSKDYYKIKKLCKKIGIDLIVTPWDEESVDFLKKLGVKALKIASIDANNYQFCQYVAKNKIPTIISSGMCTVEELMITNKIFNKHKCPHMFMHCTSAYPSNERDKHLNCIPLLRKKLKCEIGFSGHGKGIAGSVGSIALGANVIEKHSTLNKKMLGPDHSASLEFSELKRLIDEGKKVYLAMGTSKKIFRNSEKILHSILIKKLVARKNIKKGTKLKEIHIKPTIVYSDKGYLPKEYFKILNKTTKKDLKIGHIFSNNDFK